MGVKRKAKERLRERDNRAVRRIESVEGNKYLEYSSQHALIRDLRKINREEEDLQVDLRRLLTEIIKEADTQLLKDSLVDKDIDSRQAIENYYVLLP
jgi:hypothetical protein